MLIIIGIATAINLIILKWKFEQRRFGDMALDFLALAILSAFFGTTLGGMSVAMVSSLIISIYLLVYPPRYT